MFGLHAIRENEVEEYYGKALRFAKEEREKRIMTLLLISRRKKPNPLSKMRRSF